MTAYWDNGIVQLQHGDCRDVLARMPAESVHCVVTSPPYWGLRDYGLKPTVWGGEPDCDHEWLNESYQRRSNDGGSPDRKQETNVGALGRDVPIHHSTCSRCQAWLGTLGLEPTPELYVEHLVSIFREVRRVLRDDGTLWLNMGDSYASNRPSPNRRNVIGNAESAGKRAERPPHMGDGIKDKDLVMMPARVALALQADGWWLRSDCIWAKPNPMPESVTDRPTTSHEYVYLLTKSERYYYDAEAIREPATDPGREHGRNGRREYYDDPRRHPPSSSAQNLARSDFRERGRNRRTVWEITTSPFGMEMCEACGLIYTGAQFGRLPSTEYEVVDPETGKTEKTETKTAKVCRRCASYDAWMSHFATFPEKLVEPCVLAGTAERGVCADCGAPWERVVEATGGTIGKSWHDHEGDGAVGQRTGNAAKGGHGYERKSIGWRPTCDHDASTGPAAVLDLFGGSGTVGLVAQRLGRRAVLIDASGDYLALARRRIEAVPLPMKMEA